MAGEFTHQVLEVKSPSVIYTEDLIESSYTYESTHVEEVNQTFIACPNKTEYVLRTQRHVPKVGLMLVGLGGNNGTTLVGGLLAHVHDLRWNTKEGEQKPSFLGSLTQASTCKLGNDKDGKDVYVPIKRLVPLLSPEDLVIGGWDISSMPLGNGMKRASVFDYDLQRQLFTHMQKMIPLPSIYNKDFIAANQEDRADNVIQGTVQEQMDQVRTDIRNFKRSNGLEKVFVVWTANTERFSDEIEGVNDSSENLLSSISKGHPEISPSTLFATASILENATYINGSPQNTFVPGLIELANEKDVFIAGDDFKSGQTKLKSVFVDFLVSSGIKPASIVSYNHLGNNDGKNLSSPKQFRSKEISKTNVVQDMVESNAEMFDDGKQPDHTVVIKYVPYVGDSKRAMDEYTSEIFMGGKNTIVMHNTCEDSLLATPIILDLVILAEFSERLTIRENKEGTKFERMNCVLSWLGFFLKAPLFPKNTQVVNSLFPQRQAIINILRACVGLHPENHMLFEARTKATSKPQMKKNVK